ncbi:MAG: mannonate dehydratase [Balneolaceae bacterium]|nr:MAG: mannonate dehydratase [Balneolaceae bacterium]
MPYLEKTWRWFGPSDPVSLSEIRQTGATGIVTALHHIPNGEIWESHEIEKRKREIEAAGLRWSVVESVPVHEEIKRRAGRFRTYIQNYQQTLRNLAECDVPVVCYNFMPVLDWTRTELHFPLESGASALRFDEIDLALFDLFLLKRTGAETDYSNDVISAAEGKKSRITDEEKEQLTATILAGLPGAEEGYTTNQFLQALSEYDGITDNDLRTHLKEFLLEIAPVAEECGVRLAIHPDDPPFPLFGLPRVVSTESDARELLDSVNLQANGLCFCSGSYGARPDNDLPGMIRRLGERIHFIHLRNVQLEEGRSFHEAAHLVGSVGMADVMQAIVTEQKRRVESGRSDSAIPMRPDHGHRMLDDFSRESNPGYSLIGRMRGLAELRGLEMGIRSLMTNSH